LTCDDRSAARSAAIRTASDDIPRARFHAAAEGQPAADQKTADNPLIAAWDAASEEQRAEFKEHIVHRNLQRPGRGTSEASERRNDEKARSHLTVAAGLPFSRQWFSTSTLPSPWRVQATGSSARHVRCAAVIRADA
jgi:hypothetical protein